MEEGALLSLSLLAQKINDLCSALSDQLVLFVPRHRGCICLTFPHFKCILLLYLIILFQHSSACLQIEGNQSSKCISDLASE